MQNALCQTYNGHAGPIARVMSSANKRYLISIGQDDRTILLWKHETEIFDESDDESEDDIDVNLKAEVEEWLVDAPSEIPNLAPRSVLFEATTKNRPHAELVELVKGMVATGIEAECPPKPWLKSVVEPSISPVVQEEHAGIPSTTDVDFELSWMHGYRCHDSRNNLRYSSAGKIVYAAASIVVALNKTSGRQSFLQAAHSDEVVSVGAHPNGQIFASGDAGREPVIVIWSSIDMRVIARIENSGHSSGIPLLAFNTQGNLLASVGMDDCNTLVLHDWANGIEIMRTATDKGKIFCLAFLSNPTHSEEGASGSQGSSTHGGEHVIDTIVTGGHKHLSFWYNNGNNVMTQHGIWGNKKRGEGNRSNHPECSQPPLTCRTCVPRALLLVPS